MWPATKHSRVIRPSIYLSIFEGLGAAGKSSIQPAIHLSIHPSIYAVQQVMQRSSLTRTMKPLSVLLAPPVILPLLLLLLLLLARSCMHLALQTIFAVVVVFTQQTTSGSGLCWLFGNPLFHFSERPTPSPT